MSPKVAAAFDVALTSASLRALRGLRHGRIAVRDAHTSLQLAPEPYDAVAAVRALQTSVTPATQFDMAEPPFVHYRLLKEALARYHALAGDTSLARITLRRPLRPGAIDNAVPALRRLIVALGDLPVPMAAGMVVDSSRYDSLLVAGVSRFQRRHGLPDDGVVGAETQAQLTVPMSTRATQIALTMERWRWLPHGLGEAPPIIVNVPAFRLHAFTNSSDGESGILSMNVVVGQAPKHRTPIFSGSLRHLIFLPYWDVPPSIMRKEILPKAYRDRGFLARDDFEVVSNSGTVLGTSLSALNAAAAGRARLRQRPGVKNVLGGVKFVFPNRFSVYMHDTPTRKLFARPRRDASHGCIRLEEPARLAALLLRDQPTWDSAAIASAMSAGSPRQVNLTRPVPVYIVHATVVAREDGSLYITRGPCAHVSDSCGHDASAAARWDRWPSQAHAACCRRGPSSRPPHCSHDRAALARSVAASSRLPSPSAAP